MSNFMFILYANKKELGRIIYYSINTEQAEGIAQGMTHAAHFCGKKKPGVLVFEEQPNKGFKRGASYNVHNCGELWEISPEEAAASKL